MSDKTGRNGEPFLRTDTLEGTKDGRLTSPSAQRNAAPILDALVPLLKDHNGLVLEIGSGTGQHIAGWATAMPGLDWQPSDAFEAHLDSVRAWVDHSGCTNLRTPVWLDAAEEWPPLGDLTAVISLNVIHITPWVVTQGIVRGAGQAMEVGGLLVFYGPFKEGGVHTGDGNARFDDTLGAQDAAWGIRDLDDVAALAVEAGFAAPEVIEMPANNRLVTFSKT